MQAIKNGGDSYIQDTMASMKSETFDEVLDISFTRNDSEDNVLKCVTAFVPELKQLELLIESCENLKEAVKAEFVHQFCIEFFDENTKCYNMKGFTNMLEESRLKAINRENEERRMAAFQAQIRAQYQAQYESELAAAKEAMKAGQADMEL